MLTNYLNFVENSKKALRNYIEKNNLKSVIIGISGGIDSCLSTIITYQALKGSDVKIIGRSLPTNSNTTEETKLAELIGNTYCSDFKIINISEKCENIINVFEYTDGEMTSLQKGNIKARYRMIYLRHLASLHNGIVLDNDNFTEWNLGFWTIGGDSPGDYNLGLHYLWKTEIYKLANFLLKDFELKADSSSIAKNSIEILNQVINITPTDGNGVSKSDCEQFQLDNYEQVDDVLNTMYYTDHTTDDYVRLIDSYNEQGVDRVMVLHQNSEYKRKNLPIIPTKKELFQ